jgi:hypothetical protein
MTIPAAHQHEAGVVVTLPKIFEQVQATDSKVDKLSRAVEQMVAIHERLDSHHDRLNEHGARIRTLETNQAVATATARKPTPWYLILGAVTGVLTGASMAVGLIVMAFRIGEALQP